MSITRERLKELIVQGATVYSIYHNEVRQLHLDSDYVDLRDEYRNKIFETEKDAKFALRYKRIPHTEYLDLPTWEEIKEVKFYEFFVNEYDYMLQYQPVSKKIALYEMNNKGDYFLEDATEENYYKALDECVKLWKGEE